MPSPTRTHVIVTERGSLAPLFQPRAIAVVGASNDPTKLGNAAMASLSGFSGALLPVNPRGDWIMGHRAYPSVMELPHRADLAVLAVPPPAVPGVVRDCGAAGVRAAVICAGGFAETGDSSGGDLQEEIRMAALTHGVRVLGPNTAGFVNCTDLVNATFVPEAGSLVAGPLSIVAQSSGMNLVLAFMAANAGLGIRLGVGLGNAVDVGFEDVLAFLATDDATSVVAVHIEGLEDGDGLVEAIRDVVTHRPVVALKVGRSDVQAFAASHTGSMIGSFELTRAALAQAGAIVVDDPTELVDAARGLAACRLAPRPDAGVGLVTAQAGPGLVVADALRSSDVTMPSLGADTRAKLRELLPPFTFQENPVDTARPDATFPDVVRAVADDDAIDLLACFAIEESVSIDPLAALRGVAATDTPVLFGTGGPSDLMGAQPAEFGSIGIPVFDGPDRLARAVRAIVADSRARHRRETERPRTVIAAPGLRGPLDELGAKELLDQLGLATPARRVCVGRDEARAALASLGAPVVVKVLDPTITHKTDAGGVALDVRGDADLDAALARFAARGLHPDRLLIEGHAPPGPELIVGATRDTVFGPTVMLGLGGTLAELVPPAAFRLAPLTDVDVTEMIHALPSALLDGFRGMPPVDEQALGDVLAALSGLLVCSSSLRSIEVNPLRVVAGGVLALDALVVAEPRPEVAQSQGMAK
jgi:acyl-CoA synthetase (NDP forming)